MIPDIKARSRRLLDPIVAALVAMRIHPNTLTVIGLCAAIVAGVVVARGSLRGGAAWLLVSGLFDVLDGGVARSIGRPTLRGAFLDSTLDRYAEGAFLLGLAWYAFARAESVALFMAVLSVLLGSLLVSYTRARAEGLGTTCKVGIMERPERFAAIIVICLAGGVALLPLLWVFSTLIHVTAVHRIVHVYNKLP